MTDVLLVKAIYNYKPTNNDELALQKGDLITVTQTLEGGWWEGTLNGVTGWFPSNYVKQHNANAPSETSQVVKNTVLTTQVPTSPNLNDVKLYRGIVFQDIVESETNHLSELQSLISSYLNPLKETDILSDIEYSYLVNNLEEVCISSRILLQMLEDVKSCSLDSQRIGGEFIRVSVYMKNIHLIYSSGHPRAAAVIEKNRSALSACLEDEKGLSVLGLTTGLSKPLRRVDKYPALLMELLRHTPENHLDRGDTQRAAVLYRDIASCCASIRKQKEMELEIMTEPIKNWEGEPIMSLGAITHMGSVILVGDDLQRCSRFLVAFPEILLILSSKGGGFCFEGKLPLASLSVRRLDPSDGPLYAFEMTGSGSLRSTVICASSDSLQQWLSIFPNVRTSSLLRHSSLRSSSLQSRLRDDSPEDRRESTGRIGIAAAARQVGKKVWPNWNLRPHPPLRASLLRPTSTGATGNGQLLRRGSKKEREHESEGDIPVRQMMEALNTHDRSRNTAPSATASAPPRLNFEEDKIIIDGFDDQIQEKTLVDTVYMLKDYVLELKGEVSSLKQALSEEVAARRKLEGFVLQQFPDQQLDG